MPLIFAIAAVLQGLAMASQEGMPGVQTLEHGAESRSLHPVDLRVEHLPNPSGIDERNPRLSWVYRQTQGRSISQSAFQIQVATSESLLAGETPNMWDSGKVSSDSSTLVSYVGKELQSDTRYYWRVRGWDQAGMAGAWSEVASFTTGLFDPKAEFTGAWIAAQPEAAYMDAWRAARAFEQEHNISSSHPHLWYAKRWNSEKAEWNDFPEPAAPLLRREFEIPDKPIRRATAHVTGLGYFRLYLNGNEVGDRVLEPLYTDYTRRVYYSSIDVTDNLRPGSNAVGMMLGNGWYSVINEMSYSGHQAPWIGAPKALLQLNIHFEDGEVLSVVSDEQWQTAPGPVIFNDLRAGVIYDGRRALPGWSAPAQDTRDWQPVHEVEGPSGELKAQTAEPIRVLDRRKPAAVKDLGGGEFLVDFGAETVGWIRLRVPGSGHRGREILVEWSSDLDKNGRIRPAGFTDRNQQYRYIVAGDPEEWTESYFHYYGGRYAQVSGYPGTLTVDDVEILQVANALEVTGQFESSDPLINQVYRNSVNTLVGNQHGILTDCPTREKHGWSGDCGFPPAFASVHCFNAAQFYRKHLTDFRLHQRPDGAVPLFAPAAGYARGGSAPPDWGSHYLLTSFLLYQQYGDLGLFEQHYDSYRRQLDHLQEEYAVPGQEGVLRSLLGDWMIPHERENQAPEGSHFMGTAIYSHLCHVFSQVSALLGKNEEAAEFAERAAHYREKTNRHFLDQAQGIYVGNFVAPYRQAPNAAALAMDLVPEDRRQAVLDNLVWDVVSTQRGNLTTGSFATRYLLEALTGQGRPDVAHTVLAARDYPGWIYPVVKYNATSIPESWCGGTVFRKGTRNHPPFAWVAGHYLHSLAGIQPAEPGFRRVRIAPQPEGDLEWVKATYDSVRGPIRSEWSKQPDGFHLKVEIPVNTTAEIRIPSLGHSEAPLFESGRLVRRDHKPPEGLEGIDQAVWTDGQWVISAGSGTYDFHLAYPDAVVQANEHKLGIEVKGDIELVAGRSSAIEVALVNQGNAAFQPTALRLSLPDGIETSWKSSSDQVLRGGERRTETLQARFSEPHAGRKVYAARLVAEGAVNDQPVVIEKQVRVIVHPVYEVADIVDRIYSDRQHGRTVPLLTVRNPDQQNSVNLGLRFKVSDHWKWELPEEILLAPGEERRVEVVLHPVDGLAVGETSEAVLTLASDGVERSFVFGVESADVIDEFVDHFDSEASLANWEQSPRTRLRVADGVGEMYFTDEPGTQYLHRAMVIDLDRSPVLSGRVLEDVQNAIFRFEIHDEGSGGRMWRVYRSPKKGDFTINVKDLTGLSGVRKLSFHLLTQSGLAPVKMEWVALAPNAVKPE